MCSSEVCKIRTVEVANDPFGVTRAEPVGLCTVVEVYRVGRELVLFGVFEISSASTRVAQDHIILKGGMIE